MMMRTGIINKAMETIDFQKNDPFPESLAVLYEELMDEVKRKVIANSNDARRSPSKKRAEEMIFKRFGLKTDIDFGAHTAGAVIPFFMNYNHSFSEFISMWRDHGFLADQEKAMDKLKSKEGSIDLTNARLGGFFSEYEHKMWLGAKYWVDYGLTPMEAVAITIHEIGHAFTFYEFSDRMVSTNRVLMEIAKEVSKTNDPKKKSYILRELDFGKKISDSDYDAIVNGNNKVIVGARLFKLMNLAVTDQMGMLYYNRTTSEQMADNFAAKFGCGRHLITGLDKIYQMIGAEEKYRSTRIFNVIIELVMTMVIGVVVFLTLTAPAYLMLVLGGTSGIFWGAIVLCFFYLMFYLYLQSSRESNQYLTYDHLKDRYVRLRQQVIQELKDTTLDPEFIKGRLEDIEIMDKAIAETEVHRGFLNLIFRILSTDDRNAKAMVELNRDLEELANNDLFLASAKLNTLTNLK